MSRSKSICGKRCNESLKEYDPIYMKSRSKARDDKRCNRNLSLRVAEQVARRQAMQPSPATYP